MLTILYDIYIYIKFDYLFFRDSQICSNCDSLERDVEVLRVLKKGFFIVEIDFSLSNMAKTKINWANIIGS